MFHFLENTFPQIYDRFLQKNFQPDAALSSLFLPPAGHPHDVVTKATNSGQPWPSGQKPDIPLQKIVLPRTTQPEEIFKTTFEVGVSHKIYHHQPETFMPEAKQISKHTWRNSAKRGSKSPGYFGNGPHISYSTSSKKCFDKFSARNPNDLLPHIPNFGKDLQSKGRSFEMEAKNMPKGNKRSIRLNMITFEKEDDSTLPWEGEDFWEGDP
jgi:hypothetical protein